MDFLNSLRQIFLIIITSLNLDFRFKKIIRNEKIIRQEQDSNLRTTRVLDNQELII